MAKSKSSRTRPTSSKGRHNSHDLAVAQPLTTNASPDFQYAAGPSFVQPMSYPMMIPMQQTYSPAMQQAYQNGKPQQQFFATTPAQFAYQESPKSGNSDIGSGSRSAFSKISPLSGTQIGGSGAFLIQSPVNANVVEAKAVETPKSEKATPKSSNKSDIKTEDQATWHRDEARRLLTLLNDRSPTNKTSRSSRRKPKGKAKKYIGKNNQQRLKNFLREKVAGNANYMDKTFSGEYAQYKPIATGQASRFTYGTKSTKHLWIIAKIVGFNDFEAEFIKLYRPSKIETACLVSASGEPSIAKSWNEKQVMNWMMSLRSEFSKYYDSFVSNGVNGELLLELKLEDFTSKDIGMAPLAAKRVLNETKKLVHISTQEELMAKYDMAKKPELEKGDESDSEPAQKRQRFN